MQFQSFEIVLKFSSWSHKGNVCNSYEAVSHLPKPLVPTDTNQLPHSADGWRFRAQEKWQKTDEH